MLFLLGIAKTVGGWILGFLNTKVDADARVAIAKTSAISTVAGSVLGAEAKADEVKAKMPWWQPIGILTAAFLAVLLFHASQVVLDSTTWHITLGDYYLPEWQRHVIGSWHVAELPGVYAATEQAVIQSLYVGVATAATGMALIRALR